MENKGDELKSKGDDLKSRLARLEDKAILELPSFVLTEEGCKYLANFLKNNTTVTDVNLWESNVGDAGLKWFSFLTTNNSITRLNLAVNDIGDAGIKTLAEILMTNSTILQLDLSMNKITAEGAKPIGNLLQNSIKSNISPINLKMFSTSSSNLSKITTLNLSMNFLNNEGIKDIAMSLHNNSTLTHLNLSMNFIDDEGAKYIAECLEHNSHLTSINLSMNNISDQGFKCILTHSSKLLQLDFGANLITDEGLELFTHNSLHNLYFSSVSLYENKITSKSVTCIIALAEKSPQLGFIDLNSTEIDEEGGKILLNSLEKHTKSPTIDLTGCKITSEFSEQVSKKLISYYASKSTTANRDKKRNDPLVDQVVVGGSSNAAPSPFSWLKDKRSSEMKKKTDSRSTSTPSIESTPKSEDKPTEKSDNMKPSEDQTLLSFLSKKVKLF